MKNKIDSPIHVSMMDISTGFRYLKKVLNEFKKNNPYAFMTRQEVVKVHVESITAKTIGKKVSCEGSWHYTLLENFAKHWNGGVK